MTTKQYENIELAFLRPQIVTAKRLMSPVMSVVLSVVQLTDRQKKIRELILKDSFISAQQMSVVLSVVTRTIWRDLADLQKKGGA